MADIMLKLKKKYDEKKINDIEGDVEHFKKHHVSAQKAMVEVLHYLEVTERYKENPSYKASPFDVYINDRFCIRKTTYMDMRIAFHNFREESLKYGPGLVSSIKKKCGAENMRTVLDEIKTADSKTKKPISRKKIQDVMDKYRKEPVVKQTPVIETVDWKAKYETEKAARIATEKELETAKEQIARLKATVLRLRSAQQAIEQAAIIFRGVKENQLPA